MAGQVAYILLSQALFQAVIAWQWTLSTAAGILALFATAGAALVIRRARPRGGKPALQAGRSEV